MCLIVVHSFYLNTCYHKFLLVLPWFESLCLHGQGIVVDSYAFVDRADLVREVKERGFVLFTWGDTNNSSANIEAQDKAGVDAIICDW